MIIFISAMFIFFPIATSLFSIIMYFNNDKYSKYYAILFSFALSLIAYNIFPKLGFDYYVYVKRMELLQGKSLLNAFDSVEGFVTEPLSNLLFYIIAQTNNHRLLPLTATFISYSTLLVIYDFYAKKNKISPIVKLTVILMVFSWVYFISIATGIRFSLGTVIIIYGIYREFYLNKNAVTSLIIYFIAALFHTALYPFLLVRTLVNFYKGRILKRIIAIILCSWSFYQKIVTNLIGLIPFEILKGKITEKYVIYENEYILGSSLNAVIYHNLKWVYVILVVFALHSMTQTERSEERHNMSQTYVTTLKLTTFFTIGSLGNQLFSGRYIMMLMLITPPIIMNFIQYGKFIKLKPLFIYVCIIYSLIGLYVQIVGVMKLKWYLSPIEQLVNNIFSLLIN